MLQVSQLTYRYKNRRVLDDLSLVVESSQLLVLVGENGSGKSTLLRVLAGLAAPDKGKISIDPRVDAIGYAPERMPLLQLTPSEYLTAMGRVHRISKTILSQRIEELHRQWGISHSQYKRMGTFSKGMLQKVNLMQAMLHQPDFLLLDEPMSGLDQEAQQELRRQLLAYRERGATIVAACHESILTKDADQVVELSGGKLLKSYSKADHLESLVIGMEYSECHNTSQHNKRIKCCLRHNDQMTVIQQQIGFMGWITAEERHTLVVAADHCDDMLRLLLKIDATICTVSDEEDCSA
ncbi:ABC transporter ATP-binding protein [Paenibacillus sp. UMB4589-SE434]|uniref:ABC transporter ATP-binding protein n=1 Tax=Paenibacillus sp. UMB4589-SE434 TaxID=3046314 RepID=UPI00254BB18E|nr:ABC transporter ATP-binding protein [Paenibacillus sp. UMB4589-SE434]MDK8180480.1 ABC transporter ATP-binding protein [Paenibacillus sp. UMB4589-SE434]